MSDVTRRVFIKRGGAATLGSALGLGLLPSLTRKLHATDQSGDVTNCKLNHPLLPLSEDYAVMGGVLTMSITLAASSGNGVCSGSAVMNVMRSATYTRKLLPRLAWSYTATFREISNVTWQCLGGVPTATSVTHPVPPTSLDAAIANPNNPSETIGTLSMEVSNAANPAVQMTATVIIGDESASRTLGPLSYRPACC